MTKREMVEAMMAGKTLVSSEGHLAYYDDSVYPPFVCQKDQSSDREIMLSAWITKSWRIKPEPKKRPMTRDEVLGVLVNGAVVRHPGGIWSAPWEYAPIYKIEHYEEYEYATITPDGKIGEPKKFEVEE